MSTDQIIRDALQLPAADKARLAERLLDSLSTSDQRKIDLAWATEAEDRIDAHERGEIGAMPAEDVLRDLRSRKQ